MALISREKTSSLGMVLLALFPVLYAYGSSLSFNYGELSFMPFLIVTILSLGTICIFALPKNYLLFWAYVAIALMMLNLGSFKVTYLIPGGISFTLFSLMVGLYSNVLEMESLYKAMKIVFLFASIVLVAQILGLLPGEYNKSLILPISHHLSYADTDYEALLVKREYSTRPTSIFLEPAYFAQYASIFLSIELFYKTRENALYSKTAIVVSFVLLLMRSGCALIGLAVVWAAKLISIMKSGRSVAKTIIVAIPLALIAIYFYVNSEVGSMMLERTAEFSTEGASGYQRLLQGFFIYDYLPMENKIFGISGEELNAMNIPFLSVKNDGSVSMFTNGFFTLLIRNGIIGFLLCMLCYVSLYRATNALGKVSLLLLFTLSFIEQAYLLFPMLLCTVIAMNNKYETLQ